MSQLLNLNMSQKFRDLTGILEVKMYWIMTLKVNCFYFVGQIEVCCYSSQIREVKTSFVNLPFSQKFSFLYFSA